MKPTKSQPPLRPKPAPAKVSALPHSQAAAPAAAHSSAASQAAAKAHSSAASSVQPLAPAAPASPATAKSSSTPKPCSIQARPINRNQKPLISQASESKQKGTAKSRALFISPHCPVIPAWHRHSCAVRAVPSTPVSAQLNPTRLLFLISQTGLRDLSLTFLLSAFDFQLSTVNFLSPYYPPSPTSTSPSS